jgi:hypothetical protein
LGLPATAPQPATAKVRCGGWMHSITFDGQHLHLPDHLDLKRDKVLFQFGTRCHCLEVLEGWDKRHRKQIPAALLGIFDRWRLRRYERRRHGEEALEEEFRLQNGLRRNVLDKIRGAAKAEFAKCSYRQGVAGAPELCVWVGHRPNAKVEFEARLTRSDLFCPVSRWWFDLLVEYGWYRRVYSRGLAAIDRRFILDVLEEDDVDRRKSRQDLDRPIAEPWWVTWLGENPDLSQGSYVLAVFRGRGNSVRPRPARVVEVLGPDGQPRKVLKPCDRARGKKGET